MIFTILNWISVLICTLGFGLIGNSLIEKLFSYHIKNFISILFCGLSLLIFYSMCWSIFAGVGAIAFLTAFTLSALGIFFNRTYLVLSLKKCCTFTNTGQRIGISAFILLSTIGMALISGTEPEFIDTYLYHAQNIHWIEDFGLVRGLGNLLKNYAYNSSFLVLQALCSWKWLCGQSLHGMNGFMGLIAWIHCSLRLKGAVEKRKAGASDFICLSAIIYIIYAAEMISSPGTDFGAMIFLFFIMEHWSRLLEEGCADTVPYGLLCLAGLMAASLKLSVAAVVMLTLQPLSLLIKDKDYKKLFIFLSIGILLICPMLIRSVLLSGYLLYPYGNIDLFKVDWKIPMEVLKTDSAEIITWGRNLNDASKIGLSFFEWFPVWFTGLNNVYKLLFCFNLAIVIFTLIFMLLHIKDKRRYRVFFFILVTIVSTVAWFFSAPLIRYGIVYLLVLPAVCMGFIRIKKSDIVLSGILIIIMIMSIGKFFIKNKMHFGTMLYPADYAEPKVEKFFLDGKELIYYPVDGTLSGYHVFPCVPFESCLYHVGLRGDKLEEGFRHRP